MKINIEEIKKFISEQSQETKIYLGCDSERFKIEDVWHADFMLVVVCHINGKNGCKIFGGVERERDYDNKANKPSLRLMSEIYKVAALYEQLIEVIGDRHVEIHIDINPDEQFGSNCVYSQAVGYIRGVCGLDPKVKPNALAASFAADRFKGLGIFAGECDGSTVGS